MTISHHIFPHWIIFLNWNRCNSNLEKDMYCILRGYFHSGFIFANFASQISRKFPLQFMSIYSNEYIRKNHEIKPSWISAPSPKSRKCLYNQDPLILPWEEIDGSTQRRQDWLCCLIWSWTSLSANTGCSQGPTAEIGPEIINGC